MVLTLSPGQKLDRYEFKVNKKGTRYLVKHEKESGILRKYHAWTIPYQVVSYENCDYYTHITEKDTYYIKRSTVIEQCKTYTFNVNNEKELKYVVPVHLWQLKSEL